MGKVMKLKTRGPSKVIERAHLLKRKVKLGCKSKAQAVEDRFRKSGGYGKSVVSIHAAPKGGILKSPAWKKLITRCANLDVLQNGKPPAPEKRDGAPIKGGYNLKKYPVNVIVDAQRAPWLPDNWAQVMKNTGPGGVYHGWMSPEGKFYYHRYGYPSAMEECLGRKLTVLDGIKGLMRSVQRIVKPGNDQKFFKDCLSAEERKHIAPKEEFHFGVVSGKRANIESGQHDIMIVEGHFQQVGIKPTWYVDQESLEDYKKLGLNCKVGGKLVPARNMVLDDAKAKRRVAVEISDDISKWVYFDCDKQNYSGQTDFSKANKDILGIPKHSVSPLAAAQFILAKMRADPGKPKLGGVFPTANAAMTLGQSEFGKHHFILGDFFVAEPSSRCRFDLTMTLKEDYDYTCSHLKEHGSVMRCNRLFLTVKHATNAGGAVDARDSKGEKEKKNIAILQRKWPGVFKINKNRKGIADSEVTMRWKTSEPSVKQVKHPLGKQLRAKVKKVMLKAKAQKATEKPKSTGSYSATAVLEYTKKLGKVDYLNHRCKRLHNKKVGDAFNMTYQDTNGKVRPYSLSDLKYDIECGRLRVKK